MKYFFIAGERSGDQHASRLIRKLKQCDESAIICGWGGEQMRAAGAKILTTYHDIAFMGFLEVFRNILTLYKKLQACQEDISRFDPDVVVLVDFPGFNLRMAKFARSLGKKTCYYISPKIWAWKKNRIKTIRSAVDEMLVILPFEKAFYKKEGYKATYVGNPSVEDIQNYVFDEELTFRLKQRGKNIAFLPGSRIQEVESAIHIISRLSHVFDDYHFLVAAVDNVDSLVYQPLENVGNVTVLYNKPYEILKASEAAVVTSGTASLETALLEVPQVVVYKTSFLTYLMAKMLANVRFISLVNLIAGRKVVKELIQGNYNPIAIATALRQVLNDETTKKRISEGYSEIRTLLGTREASQYAARAIWKLSRS